MGCPQFRSVDPDERNRDHRANATPEDALRASRVTSGMSVPDVTLARHTRSVDHAMGRGRTQHRAVNTG